MSITSWLFAAFVAAVVGVDVLLRGPAARRWPSMGRAGNVWLLFASATFYALLSGWLAIAFGGLALIVFWVGSRASPGGKGRTAWLWAGIGLNLAALAWFKYTGFFAAPVAQGLARAGISVDAEALNIGLPIGLSFLILQMISYLIDVWRGQIAPSGNVVEFGLYALYFPRVTAGPIERARTFLPALRERPPLDGEATGRGLGLIVVGLLRKLVIANTLAAMIPNAIFTSPRHNGAPILIAGVLAYGIYLLNDFAGYTSIVRGVSELLGIPLSRNFLAPYFSRNFTEFWNQWHITLSNWLRDYIYFPISRALLRRNLNPRWLPNILIPPMVTMLVSGLWHGATPGLLVWGGLHGLYQVVERVLTRGRPALPANKQPIWRQGVSMAIVFVLVMAAWIPFRVPWASMRLFLVELTHWNTPVGFTEWRFLLVAIPALGLDALLFRSRDEQVYLRWPALAQSAALAVALLLIVITGLETIRPFVYQAF